MARDYLKGFEEAALHERVEPVSRYLRGFNRKENDVIAQSKNDNEGYVFMTKPLCNLSMDNLMLNSRLIWLSDTNKLSMAAAIRCSLMADPNIHNVVSVANGLFNEPRSSLIDDFNPFIPMVTSSVKSLTGWPDRITEYLQSDEGIAKEVHAYVDTRPENFGTYDLTLAFDSRDGDFINGLLQSLWEYQASVSTGPMVPFPSMITERELDYNVRFYRLILDNQKKYVRKIACTGASILGADTSGSDFDYSSESLILENNNEISVPFKCLGAMYNDPLIIRMFNDTVFKHNPNMSTTSLREENFVKLNEVEKTLLSIGYPYINTRTYELEWWAPLEVYNFVLGKQERRF